MLEFKQLLNIFFKFLLKWICSFIIFVCGWKFFSHEVIHTLHTLPKAIIIYPHTSYWDFVVIMIYKIVYNLENVRIVVNEGIYKKYSILEKLNCFPATAKEKNNGNFTETTIQKFKDLTNYYILISPEGTLKNVPWRSGYYYLAKGLNVPIYIVGFDYCKHEIILKHGASFNTVNEQNISLESTQLRKDLENTQLRKDFESTQLRKDLESTLESTQLNLRKEFESTQLKLRKDFENIIPLYPECSNVPIKCETLPTAIDYCTLTTIIGPLYGLIRMYFIDFSCFLFLLLAYIFSILYHRSHECSHKVPEQIAVIWSIIYVTCRGYFLSILKYDPCTLFLVISTSIFYYLGMGRHCKKERTKEYILYHSLFHIFFSMMTLYQVYDIPT